MPLPTRSDVHVDAVMSGMSVKFIQNNAAYFSGEFMPDVPVTKKTDLYFKFDRGDFFRDDVQERAPGAAAGEVGFRVTTGSYSAKRYAAKYKLADEIMDNADQPVQLEQAASEIITQKCLIKRDRLFATSFLTTGVWGKDKTGVGASPSTDQFLQWDLSGATPRKDLRQYAKYVQKTCGFRPNRLLLGQSVYETLIVHADFSDLIKYTQTGIVTPDLLARALDIEKIIVAGSVYNTAKQNQTASMSFIANDVALMAYVEPSPAINKPSAGYSFSWKKYDGINPKGAAIKRWHDDDLEADIFVGEMYTDMRIVMNECGLYMAAAVSAAVTD